MCYIKDISIHKTFGGGSPNCFLFSEVNVIRFFSLHFHLKTYLEELYVAIFT